MSKHPIRKSESSKAWGETRPNEYLRRRVKTVAEWASSGRLGVCMSCRKACLLFLCSFPPPRFAQVAHSEQVQITPPLIRAVDPPAADATAADLERQADQLARRKLFLDALDYYRAALGQRSRTMPEC